MIVRITNVSRPVSDEYLPPMLCIPWVRRGSLCHFVEFFATINSYFARKLALPTIIIMQVS